MPAPSRAVGRAAGGAAGSSRAVLLRSIQILALAVVGGAAGQTQTACVPTAEAGCYTCNSPAQCKAATRRNCADAIYDVCNTTQSARREIGVVNYLQNEFSCSADNENEIFPDFCIDCVGLLSTDELPCTTKTTKYLLLSQNPNLTNLAGSELECSNLTGHNIATVDLSDTGITQFGTESLNTTNNTAMLLATLAVFNLKLNNLNLTGGVGPFAFDGLTVYNDFEMVNTTFGRNISTNAFADITVGRDMALNGSTFTHNSMISLMAFNTLEVERNFHMSQMQYGGALPFYAFYGLVVFNSFDLTGSEIRVIDPYAFYFMTVGTFNMSGSQIHTGQLPAFAFSGMVLTYSPSPNTTTTYPATYLDLSNCNLKQLGSPDVSANMTNKAGGGPFTGLIMGVTSSMSSSMSSSMNSLSQLSKLDLSNNSLTTIQNSTFDAPFQLIDLSNNEIGIYKMGWANTILDYNAKVNTTGNPSKCQSVLADNTTTLLELNRGFVPITHKIICTCVHDTGCTGSQCITGTGTFCDDKPCEADKLDLLNQAKLVLNGQFVKPRGNTTSVRNGEAVELHCDDGFTLSNDSPMVCKGGLYPIPHNVPECTPTPKSGLLYAMIVLVSFFFAMNGWLMKNSLLFVQESQRGWELECKGVVFHLPTTSTLSEACWPEGTCKPTGGKDKQGVLYKAKRIAYELVVSLLTIIPGFGVFFAARRTQHNYNKIKNDLNDGFEGERKVHDAIYAQAKAVKQIWEISLESMDFVRHADAPPLGAGAFGVVRKACWLGADVAVKELSNVESQGMNNTLVRRKAVSRDFLKEAEIMKALQHPNIVHFYGIGHRYNNKGFEKEHFLVQELMQKGTLKDYLHDKARIPDEQLDWPLRHRFLNDICSALSFLHSRDPPMVHRDLKPANCLLDGHLTLKVADFGTVKWKQFQARQRSSSKSARIRDQQPGVMAIEETGLSENDGSPVGTPLYMAPECFSRELAGRDGPGTMVDVWAFSFLLFEICTREKPFAGVRFFMTEIMDGKRPTDFMTTDHAQIPNHLYDLMASCWRKEPTQRPRFRATATAGGSIEERLIVAATSIHKATTL